MLSATRQNSRRVTLLPIKTRASFPTNGKRNRNGDFELRAKDRRSAYLVSPRGQFDRHCFLFAMGGCSSCASAAAATTAVGAAAGTAKVVLPDGGLREYSRPVTAAGALGKDAACFFVCDADEMEFDAFVSGVGAREELRPGQLYFALPRSMLKRRLQAEDLARLAVKASAALVGAAGQRDRGVVSPPQVFPAGVSEAVPVGGRAEKKGRRWCRGGGGRRKFAPDLSAIPE
ncbi:hypothetical protein GW17_00038239 [Ensete ventricosum]|nr:hypothetical protein GW17_00038239 [Ensete ventricosum]